MIRTTEYPRTRLATCISCRSIFTLAVLVIAATVFASPSRAAGQIDACTLVSVSHGIFNGVQYTRYEAMFEGVTSNNRPYRVPCQIVTPTDPSQGSRFLLFDWLVVSTAYTIVGQEQADARYTMTDDFLFGLGLSYATVRCDPFNIGKSSPYADHTRPWSDNLLNTSSEFIASAGDEFDIVVDFNKALRTDPVALHVLGVINRRLAFGYSASGGRLRGLLRLQMGVGLFDFSLVGGNGSGYTHPLGNEVGDCWAEKAPLPGAGLEIDFNSETDVILSKGQKARHEEANYRDYEFAGASHIRNIDVAEFGLPDPEKANPAEWTPFIRALFVAGLNWCDGITPPPTIWFGVPNDPSIARDAKGNALVRYVGGQPVNTDAYRLPEVAVGENQYIPVDPSYNDGSFLGFFRTIGGGHVDLTGTFTDHDAYVDQVTTHARRLQAQGYLLEADADAIILRAVLSGIGN
jgi:hypothetical protein